MKRTALRSKPRPPDYAVSPELHWFVRQRDGECIGAKAVRAGVIEKHVCRDKWGMSHGSHVIALLSVDHIHLDGSGVGKPRATSDPEHLVAMCAYMNINGVPAVIRQFEREYLRSLPEPEHTHVDPVFGCPGCPPLSVMA